MDWAVAGFKDTLLRLPMKLEVVHENAKAFSRELASVRLRKEVARFKAKRNKGCQEEQASARDRLTWSWLTVFGRFSIIQIKKPATLLE